jgi:hypothetical protein
MIFALTIPQFESCAMLGMYISKRICQPEDCSPVLCFYTLPKSGLLSTVVKRTNLFFFCGLHPKTLYLKPIFCLLFPYVKGTIVLLSK